MPLLAVAGRLVEKVCLTLALLGFDFLEPPGKSGNPESGNPEKYAKKPPKGTRKRTPVLCPIGRSQAVGERLNEPSTDRAS